MFLLNLSENIQVMTLDINVDVYDFDIRTILQAYMLNIFIVFISIFIARLRKVA